MLARLKAEAETRTAAKEAKQRTLVAIEVKPWDIEQDLVALWKKITTEVQQGAFVLLDRRKFHPQIFKETNRVCNQITLFLVHFHAFTDGLKWGEGFSTPEIAFGIKKLCMTFTMGVNNSSDDVQEAIQAMEDEVQSVEVVSMNVL